MNKMNNTPKWGSRLGLLHISNLKERNNKEYISDIDSNHF